jgi:hypothetical protein
MTPAQVAKQFAADNGFTITSDGRKYRIGYIALDSNEIEIAIVSGYPAALNAMKRYMSELSSALLGRKSIADAETHMIRKAARPLIGSEEWYAQRPWRLCYDRGTIQPMAYATRADALKTVRQRFAGVPNIAIVRIGA